MTLSELRKKLSDSNARWRAIESPVSLLDKPSKANLLGVNIPAGYSLPVTAAATAGAPSFDTLVDWRNRRGGNHITPVKNQLNCGSCCSFGTVGVTESMASIEKGSLLDLSEADQHFCSSHGANCGGWWHFDAFEQIRIRGVVDEASNPYGPALSGGPICVPVPNRDNKAVKITTVHRMSNAAEIKSYLTSTGPVAGVFAVFDDFFSYRSGVYHVVSTNKVGYHCIMIIGYSEVDRCWICKNSWGSGWGDGGFFKIGYGESEIDNFEKIGVTGVVLPAVSKWLGFESLGGILTSKPNAVSWGKNRIDVVVRGGDSAVFHKWWDGSTWKGWESLGGFIQGAPSISSWASGRLDVFGVGQKHSLYHRWFEGGWSNWENLGGTLSSGVTSVSWGNGRIDVFARGMNSSLWHLWFENGWHGWEDLGGSIISDPAACSWKTGRLDVFAVGTNGHLFHKWFEGGWHNWEDLGVMAFGNPGAVSWGPNRIDVFYPSQSFRMNHIWWDGAWSKEEDLGGQIFEGVGVSSWEAKRLDCFVEGTDSAMYHKWFS